MKVLISTGSAVGKIDAPPSKSAAHRALISAALSRGSTIYGISESDDIKATLSCLEALGATVEREDGAVTLGGLDPAKIGECIIDCGESGSTLRFLLPLCLISGERVTLCGSPRLMSRPLDVYRRLCLKRGFIYEESERSITVAGRLTSGDYDVSMAKSSQFVTGFLFALSRVDGESRIHIEGKAESLSYVDITMSVMRDFGINVSKCDGYYKVTGGVFRSLSYDVEGDYSNAAALDALNFVGGNVEVRGLNSATSQGDRVYPELFAKIKRGETVDLSDCPDLAPVLFALAAYNGFGRFAGTGRLRYKESDRAATMKEELSAFGANLEIGENEVTISGAIHAPDRLLRSHNDHRVVMALSVLGSKFGCEIDGAEAVRKSYPEFFRDISKLGIEVKYVES